MGATVPGFDLRLAAGYTSPTQRVRAMSEAWVAANVYCVGCDATHLEQLSNNTKAQDFRCVRCQEVFELKATKSAIGAAITDGAYDTMAQRIAAREAPNLMVMRYGARDFDVMDLFVVPRHFMTLGALEKRPPLGPLARRAGWVGCKIRLDRMPEAGRLRLIQNRRVLPPDGCRAAWRQMLFLRNAGESQPWLLAVMRRVERLGRQFELHEMYGFDAELQAEFPANANIRPKIRQQLQRLRDEGYLTFLGGGRYERVG